MLKNTIEVLVRYTLAMLVANLSVGISSLIFKFSLVTVQGPTSFSRISEIVIYYLSLSVATFFVFKIFRKKQNLIRSSEVAIVLGLIFVMHTVIVFLAQWPIVWFVSTGSLPLANLLYTGGEYIESIREIPRVYYFAALALEDFCVFTCSLIGSKTGNNL